MNEEESSSEARELTEHLVLDFMQMREFAKDPFVVAKGDGVRIVDVDGKTYLDGLAGVFVVSLGYNNQAIIEAVIEQLRTLQFAPPLHGTNPRALELAALIRQIAPTGMGTVKFLSGGSEATETAMKLAHQYHQQTGKPRKFKVISKYGAYHGATMGALSAGGGWERKSIFEPLGVGFLKVLPPNCYRCPYGKEYPNCGVTCAKVVAQTIEAEDPDTISAVIMEPISISSAGFVVPPREFFTLLRESCDKYDVTLIFDEIITGFGRLGTMFGADHYGVVPEIICCGKGMSSGYAPLAAVIVKDSVHAAFLGEAGERKEFHHGHTYGGNPVACAAGIAVLKQLVEQGVVANAKRVGAHLRGRLDEMYAKHSIVGDVRGAGMLQGVEFVRDRVTRAPFADVKPGKIVEKAAKERGLILRTGDHYAAFAPPLTLTEAEADEMCAILDESVALAQRQLVG
ncbi:MAG: aminotransferase family protein [Chloroflexota bacterium]